MVKFWAFYRICWRNISGEGSATSPYSGRQNVKEYSEKRRGYSEKVLKLNLLFDNNNSTCYFVSCKLTL